jgi:DNA-3-methyladenine glycosylase II
LNEQSPAAVVRLDVAAALAHFAAAGDPIMQALAARYLPRAPRPDKNHFHLLVSAIIAQQISGRAADAIMAKFMRLVRPDGGDLMPADLLPFTPEELRTAGLTRQKSLYVHLLAQACAAGTLDLAALTTVEDEAAIAALTAMKGIGPWTAEMHLLFVLERPDVLSVGDLGIRSAVKRLYGLEALPTPDELRALAEPWRPHRSTAMLLLWMSHDSPPVQAMTGEAFSGEPAQPALAPYQPDNLFY